MNKTIKDTTQKKSYRTRVKILDAYIKLMQKKNFDSITVKSIVEEAKITRGTFYLYFSDIYEMISYIEETLLSDMPDTPEYKEINFDRASLPTYEDCIDCSWERSWFEYYERYHVQFNTLLGPHGDASFYPKIKKSLQNALLSRMQQDNMPDDQSRSYFLNVIPDLFLLLAKDWTSTSHPGRLDTPSLLRIVNTIRIGALYQYYLESNHPLDKHAGKEV